MSNSLEDAIAALVADAKSQNKLLRVAPAAKKLAEQFPGTEPNKIAQMLIEAGLKSYINIEMRRPEVAPSKGAATGPQDKGRPQALGSAGGGQLSC